MTTSEDDFDLYDVLNVQRGASVDEVRSAFRDLSRIYHPDKHGGGSSSSTSGVGGAFMRVHHAYRILSDDVLRGFYDRYGLPGIRLTEQLSDEEGDAAAGGGTGSLVLPEDRLKDLETRVHKLVRRHEELRAQRLLSLQGSFTLSMAGGPGIHGAHLRRRYRLQYSSTTHSVTIHLCDRLRLTVGCASHVQSASGAGAAKLILAAATRLDAATNLRAALNVTGASPEAELSLVRLLSPHCVVNQKTSFSADGSTVSLNVTPWLSRTLCGSLGISCGSDSSLSLGLVQRSASSGHNVRCFLNMDQGQCDLGVQLKYKPAKGFSLRLAPSISRNGWALQATCTKAASDGLTKLQWAVRVRARGATLKLMVTRCGLRFVLPLELWPESAGPLPLPELGLAVTLWALPPLVLRGLYLLWESAFALRAVWLRCPNSQVGSQADEDRALAAAKEAFEQRQLLGREASRRRVEEEANGGLVILLAQYGDAAQVGLRRPLASAVAKAQDGAVLDVTDCLMAKVRNSKLHISDAPKSTLLGFHNVGGIESESNNAQPMLHIWYTFGGIQHSRAFGNRDIVLLP